MARAVSCVQIVVLRSDVVKKIELVNYITLDPDFPCYEIVSVRDADHFTFDYHEEPGQITGDSATVHCFEYSEIRGTFTARRVGAIRWEAERAKSVSA